TSPLLASISWTDRAGTSNTTVNSTTPVLVNDLDIRVTKGGTTYFPYELAGATTSAQQDNNVDPYERVDISGASGTYTITVTHKGTLTGGSQNFSLIVTGLTGTPVVCNATTPTGVSTSGVTTSGADVSWDAVTAATYDVRYRATGTSSWTTNAVATNSTTLSGLAASTAYEVQVRSKCTSGNSSYSASVNFTTADVPPICTTIVSSFPYSEGFEANDGWTQVTGDDGNWVRRSGSTPSSGTGPSAAAEGSNYLFLEASTNGSTGQIGANATAILESPCYDLSNESQATFTFENHMYGTSVGSLALEVSTDGTSWSNLWSLSGNQGNQWNAVSVNLNSYTGQSEVRLRFVGTTGSSWSSDIAIDDLALTTDGGGSGGNCDTINFNNFSINSFATQDAAGNSSISNSGNTLTLTNNTWKYIPYNYTVTANTVIEFEFSSSSEGEIHAVGFEDDNSLTSSRYFKVYGTQNYGVTNFDNYSSGTKTYIIPVGDSYTGTKDRLVFINDNDGGSGNTSTFSNVKIYESSCGESAFEVTDIIGTRVDVLGNEDEGILASIVLAPSSVKKGRLLKLLGPDKNLSDASYTIINMLGQILEKRKINESKTINIDAFRSGLYILKIENKFTKVNKRFIIE
ncbi:MAG: T9SS type A sorting domain-containing protein, partial [Lewinella sp.]|uniref:T9SS type A sorting domain-containing protein n=1 Tax=Lewinella sp. TaxID=2004506 RepID=UPI003D6ABE81